MIFSATLAVSAKPRVPSSECDQLLMRKAAIVSSLHGAIALSAFSQPSFQICDRREIEQCFTQIFQHRERQRGEARSYFLRKFLSQSAG
jgi:hypothetical protein